MPQEGNSGGCIFYLHLREWGQRQTQQPDFCSLFHHQPNVHITHQITPDEATGDSTGEFCGNKSWLSHLTHCLCTLEWYFVMTLMSKPERLHTILPVLNIWQSTFELRHSTESTRIGSKSWPHLLLLPINTLTPIQAESTQTAPTRQAAHTLSALLKHTEFTHCVGGLM